MEHLFKLDKFLDALKEVGNIGVGKASSSLSRLLGKKVSLKIPEIYLTETADVPGLVGGAKELVVGIYSALKGDVSGTLLVVFPTASALELTDVLQKKPIGTSKNLTSPGQTRLKEMGDALSRDYLGSLTDFLKIKVDKGPERIISTFGESLSDVVLLGVEKKYSLFISTDFEVPKTNISGKFILLIAMDSVSKIVEAIKKQTD